MTGLLFTTQTQRRRDFWELLCASAPLWWALVFVLLCSVPVRADLNAALAQTNLEKRSELALNNANAALKAARKAYSAGDNAAVTAAVSEIRASIELTAHSLRETGKNPRKHPKYFKKAEIGTRDLLRRLDTFQQEMSYVDRPMVDPLKAYIQQVHDELLAGLMGEKQK
jgi:hypothetical protein